MEAVGQLTGRALPTTFNNLLTVITGAAEILSDDVPPDQPELATTLAMIDEAAQRGAELTHSAFLAFAPQATAATTSDRYETSSSAPAIKLLRPTLGENIEIESMFEEHRMAGAGRPGSTSPRRSSILPSMARDAMPKWRKTDPRNRQRPSRRSLCRG